MTALAFPPLEKSVVVRCSREQAFDAFTARVNLWWPTSHRKFASSTLVFEPKTNGRFFERDDDGNEADFGQVLVCEPPSRLVYSWNPGAVTGPTEVEVTFAAHDGGTLVEVTHRAGDATDVFLERVALFDRGWTACLHALSDLLHSP